MQTRSIVIIIMSKVQNVRFIFVIGVMILSSNNRMI